MRNFLILGLLGATALSLPSCSGTAKEGTSDSTAPTAMQPQPVESGLYDASRYEISGENARKGSFDGRLMVAISEDQSALYVYENGNRTKIDYTVVLAAPFEKNDSGLYVTKDNKGIDVTINTDSTVNVLTFNRNDSKIRIDFSKEATTQADALTMLERMSEQKAKNK